MDKIREENYEEDALPEIDWTRKKLWELDYRYHCSIVGTCLTIQELSPLITKSEVELPENPMDYQIHGIFVQLAAKGGQAARLMNKKLNRKFVKTISKFNKYEKLDKLADAWEEAFEQGDIPGPYWAVLTHPLSTKSFQEHVFGRVHMHMHNATINNAQNIRKLNRKDQEIDNLKQRIKQVKKYWKEAFENESKQRKELDKRVCSIQKENIRLGNEVDRLLEVSQVSEVIEIQEQNRTMLEQLNELQQKHKELKEENDSLKECLQSSVFKVNKLKQENSEKNTEIEFLLGEIENLMQNHGNHYCPDRGTSRCPGPLLCGRRILYVGGRQGLIEHYRRLVERYGAEFMHHDGGQEDNKNELPNMLNKADAIFCPVDCINHNACKMLKNICKDKEKNYYILRSSGISNLEEEISRRVEEIK